MKRFLVVLLGVLLSSAVMAQDVTIDEVEAVEQFRWGVQAYHNGLFQNSINNFETSLGLDADNTRTQFWLGLVYFRTGQEDVAISLWKNLMDRGRGNAFIQSYIEILESRSGLDRELSSADRYVEAYRIEGKTEDYALFDYPCSILAADDGGFWITSFLSNEIIKFDANAEVQRKLVGDFTGLDSPFDLAMAENGFLYISEWSGDRIVRMRPDGADLSRFGSSGSKDGQLLGPQFLALDGNGYIYVTDYGNRRVSKFDLEGNFLFSFGTKSDYFSGLQQPTGIAVLGNLIYVADKYRKELVVFDDSGNFMNVIGNSFFTEPEGLTVTDDGALIVADGQRLIRVYPQSESLEIISDFSDDAGKIMKSVYDANRHLLTADSAMNKISVLTDILNMYAGLHIQIMTVNAVKFPTVQVEVAVKDRLGQPFTGLNETNFFISERKIPPQEILLTHTVDRDRTISSVYLADRSLKALEMSDDIKSAASGIFAALENTDSVSLVSASELPVFELEESSNLEEFVRAAVENGRYSGNWSIDNGIKLAASELVNKEGKRAIFFPYAGDLGITAFSNYGLTETAQYLKNNDIQFYCLYLQEPSEIHSEELEYLCTLSGGQAIYFYQNEGLDILFEGIRSSYTGRYVLEYQSPSNGGFGDIYIPLEVEAHVYARSGRDELGYFAPLEF